MVRKTVISLKKFSGSVDSFVQIINGEGGGCQIITKNITRRSFKNLIKNQMARKAEASLEGLSDSVDSS